MRRPVTLLAVLLLHAGGARAGHGLMNSFAGIDWLPAAGATPDGSTYAADTWAERARLLLATDADEKIGLCLRYAREKLAELEAMVRAGKQPAARVAIDRYRAHLTRATDTLAETTSKQRTHLTLVIVDALLEHQYIMSTAYLDLPRDSRTVIAAMMTAATTSYAQLGKTLSRRERDARFFKEEEVRWSWDMALAADAQGL